jgi:hypothetical protein
MEDEDGPARADRWLRGIAAEESLRQRVLGTDIVSFVSLRNAVLQGRQTALEQSGATEGELLAAAKARIAALEEAATAQQSELEYFDAEHRAAEERAKVAEQQLRAAIFRIQSLQDRAVDHPEPIGLPATWSEFAEWADANLAGKLALSPRARRLLKDAEFEDIQMAANSIVWLADEARASLSGKSALVLSDATVVDGVRNALCGGDAFDLQWQGQTFTANWHVKSGGNTRDPKRCLRIYWFWDESTQQIIVAEMPAHRRTDLS